jgi:hypothetical protein
LPTGTDLSALKIDMTLPAGAKIDPPITGLLDFSKGPITFTVTAEDGRTTAAITISVVESSGADVREESYFIPFAEECENIVTTNPNGTVSVKVSIPLLPGLKASSLSAVRATIWNMSYSNISYSVVGSGGSRPLTSSARALTLPYLQIAFTVPSMEELNKGVIGELRYNLQGDATNYVQTLPDGGLRFSKIPKVNAPSQPTPSVPVGPSGPTDDYDNAGGGGGGCDASGGGAIMLLFLAWAIMNMKR